MAKKAADVSNKRQEDQYKEPAPAPSVKLSKQPLKAPTANINSSFDFAGSRSRQEVFQQRKNNQESPPQIKTEAPLVLDCEDVTDDSHGMVNVDDEYQSEFQYEDNYQEENMMYQVGELEMNMGQQTNNGKFWTRRK